MPAIELKVYLFIAAVLFVCGVICMATKRNAIGVLMGVELVLNGANLSGDQYGYEYRSDEAHQTPVVSLRRTA